MIDISKYPELKAKSLISLGKIGNAYAVSAKRFDPITGEENQPEIQSISLEELQAKKAELLTAIENINQIIADCTALD